MQPLLLKRGRTLLLCNVYIEKTPTEPRDSQDLGHRPPGAPCYQLTRQCFSLEKPKSPHSENTLSTGLYITLLSLGVRSLVMTYSLRQRCRN